jgi:alkanesulfonate monooxygenase SsuD/methylene tetrahydromethanopterin reductase-like flavin-dependent oxidoreductase (luciferase family)
LQVVTFGLQGFPDVAGVEDRLERCAVVLEQLPEEFTTIWVSDHLQFSDAAVAEGWTLATYLAAAFPRFHVGHLVLC